MSSELYDICPERSHGQHRTLICGRSHQNMLVGEGKLGYVIGQEAIVSSSVQKLAHMLSYCMVNDLTHFLCALDTSGVETRDVAGDMSEFIQKCLSGSKFAISLQRVSLTPLGQAESRVVQKSWDALTSSIWTHCLI